MPYKIKQKTDMCPHQVRDGVGHSAPLRNVFGDKWSVFDTLPPGVAQDSDYFEFEEIKEKPDTTPIALVEVPTPEPIVEIETAAEPIKRKRGRPSLKTRS